MLSWGNAPIPLWPVVSSIEQERAGPGGWEPSLKPLLCPLWVRSQAGWSSKTSSKAMQKKQGKKKRDCHGLNTTGDRVQAARKAECSREKWKDEFQSTAIKAHYSTWAETCSQFTFQCKIQSNAWTMSTRIKVWFQKCGLLRLFPSTRS